MKEYLNFEHILNNEQKQHRLPGTVIIVTPCKNRSYHFISSQTFSKNEDICIQNSDNGESDVIIDQSYYKNKLESLLNLKNWIWKMLRLPVLLSDNIKLVRNICYFQQYVLRNKQIKKVTCNWHRYKFLSKIWT